MRFLLAAILSLLPSLSAAQTLDYNIANQTFPSFRVDLNNHLGAIVQQNPGTVAPAVTFPYMVWADTSGAAPVLRYRNAANSGWAAAFRIDPSSTMWLGGITTSSATITGGSINGTQIGATTPSTGAFTGLTVFGNAFLESNSPFLTLSEADGASTHRRSVLTQDGNSFQIQTRNGSGDFVAQDYAIVKNASGAVSHSWRIGGTERFSLNVQTGQAIISYPVTANSIQPPQDDTGFVGAFNRRWSEIWTAEIYSTQPLVVTSDARLKHDIADVAEAECRVADRIEIRRYRLNDDPDRIRFGAIAQEVIAAFEAEGLDWQDYAIVTGSEEETYGVAYDELQSLKLACM